MRPATHKVQARRRPGEPRRSRSEVHRGLLPYLRDAELDPQIAPSDGQSTDAPPDYGGRDGVVIRAGEDLGTALAGLERASRHRLAELWIKYFDAPPPSRTSRSLMIRAVAYKMQERALGGLSPATRRLLSKEGAAPARKGHLPRPGTVLIREWGGVAHQVTVGEGGVVYRGERYGSLSEVARAITGTRWSGPRFFGLKT